MEKRAGRVENTEPSRGSFRIVTLGCRTNQYESAAYRNQLLHVGFTEALEEEKADVCIVNTCTVTASSDQRSRYQIRRLHRENPLAKLYITGCFAERARKEVEALDGVYGVISNEEKESLIESILPHEEIPEFSIDQIASDESAQTRAFVKVQDGCNSYCSYCIIPHVRGRSRSRSLASILREVEGLISNGFKEVVLTGINIGDYDGGDGSISLADLVRAVDQVDGLHRLRLSSIDPDEVDEALLSAIVEGKTTCPSMHIVLQSGSNSILKKMNRKYTKQQFLETVARLKKELPPFTCTTDVIVGFPGETDRDFAETLEIISQVEFAKVHMFPYSRRPKTKAAYFTDHLPPKVLQKRKNILLHHSEEVAFTLRERYVGRSMEVLVEGSAEDDTENLLSKASDHTSGYTENFLRVFLPPHLKQNTLVEVECVENTPQGLIGLVKPKLSPMPSQGCLAGAREGVVLGKSSSPFLSGGKTL